MAHRSPIQSAQNVLSKSVESHLNVYSASAVMAGVSLLALVQPAEAEVVVTHVDVPICAATIDLNNDGKPDFSFPCYGSFYEHTFYVKMMVAPLTGGKAVGGARKSGGPYASALGSGAKIGPSAHFSSSVGIEQLLIERSSGGQSGGSTTSGYSLVGQWGANKGSRYLGVKFLINGQTHYGWIRMSVTRHNHHAQSLNGTITEFAYETTANKAISAGATKDDSASARKPDKGPEKPNGGSLGMLALGAQGMPMWHRENAPAMTSFVQVASKEGGRL
jgi:hypothetical protein